jgi:predicted GNAT family acetyltransferase
MEIKHQPEARRVWTDIDGYTAYVEYELDQDSLNILHTIVPPPLEGQGIASQLVKFTYDHALQQGLKIKATCSYAVAWLKRHPEYLSSKQ